MSLLFSLFVLLQSANVPAVPLPVEAVEPGELAAVKGADLDLLGEVRRIAANVEELRSQRFDRPPLAVRVQDAMQDVAAEIRAYNVLAPAQLAARGRAWEDVGLGSASSPETVLRLLAKDLEDIAFDPSGNRLLVATDRLTVDDFDPEGGDDPTTVLLMTGVRPDEPLVSHLLAHVRQRERHGADPLRPTTDALLADMAWAEGEANLIAVRYLFRGMGLSESILEHRLEPDGFLDGALLPSGRENLSPAEAALIDFVYLDGFDLAVAEYRTGGWDALDRAMSDRRSTRELLHPGRSAPSNDFPRPVPPVAEGLELVDEDTLGEQAIVVVISQGTGKDNLGLIAADGWAGGRLYRWEPAGGGPDGVTEWITRWDSEQVAGDFSYSLARALGLRFPGQTLESVAEGRRRLVGGQRIFVLEEAGTEVRLRVSHPDWATEQTSAP